MIWFGLAALHSNITSALTSLLLSCDAALPVLRFCRLIDLIALISSWEAVGEELNAKLYDQIYISVTKQVILIGQTALSF